MANAGRMRKACIILVMKPKPTSVPASTSHLVWAASRAANRGVDGAGEQQRQQGVGVVEAEHQGGHRRQGHHGATEQGGAGA